MTSPDAIGDVFFDLDGTLTDSAVGIVRCLQHAVTELGEEAPAHEALIPYIGTPLDRIFGELLRSADEARIARAIALYLDRFRAVGIRENQLYPGAVAALETLRSSGITLHVATAKKQDSADAVVALFGLESYFAGVHGVGLDSGCDKGELLRAAIDGKSLDPQRCAMVGDRHHDVAAARASGVRAVAVSWGYAEGGELEAAAPDVAVESFEQLVSLLVGETPALPGGRLA